MHNNLAHPASPESRHQHCSLRAGISAIAQASADILVIDVVPAGAGIDGSKLPYPIQVGSAQDLDNVGGASLADFMGQSFSTFP